MNGCLHTLCVSGYFFNNMIFPFKYETCGGVCDVYPASFFLSQIFDSSLFFILFFYYYNSIFLSHLIFSKIKPGAEEKCI